MLSDALLILSIMVWVLGLTLRGSLSGEMATYLLLALIVLAAIGRMIGSSLVPVVFRIGLPVASLMIYAGLYGEADLMSMLLLAGVLYVLSIGLFVILGRPLGRPR